MGCFFLNQIGERQSYMRIFGGPVARLRSWKWGAALGGRLVPYMWRRRCRVLGGGARGRSNNHDTTEHSAHVTRILHRALGDRYRLYGMSKLPSQSRVVKEQLRANPWFLSILSPPPIRHPVNRKIEPSLEDNLLKRRCVLFLRFRCFCVRSNRNGRFLLVVPFIIERKGAHLLDLKAGVFLKLCSMEHKKVLMKNEYRK